MKKIILSLVTLVLMLGLVGTAAANSAYVAPTAYEQCQDLNLSITGIKFGPASSNPTLWEWGDTDVDHTVTTVGILYRSQDYGGQGILNAPITLTIRDSVGDIMAQETKLSSCMGYNVCLLGGWWCVNYNGFTFETDVCGWPTGRYTAELTAQVGEYTVSYTTRYMEFDITQEDIDSFDCPSLTKADILKDSGVPGKGLDTAPGLQKPFNPKSQAGERAGKKK